MWLAKFWGKCLHAFWKISFVVLAQCQWPSPTDLFLHPLQATLRERRRRVGSAFQEKNGFLQDTLEKGWALAWGCGKAIAYMVLGIDKEMEVSRWLPDQYTISEKRVKEADVRKLKELC